MNGTRLEGRKPVRKGSDLFGILLYQNKHEKTMRILGCKSTFQRGRKEKTRRMLLQRANVLKYTYPSIRMVFFSGTFFASFFGIVKLRTPFSYLALMSSSVTLSPT